MNVFMEQLDEYLAKRAAEIREAQDRGVKIVGFFPGNYVPEELIYASGAIPLCLVEMGDSRVAEAGSALMPHIICPFARAQVGERVLKTNPYYSILDMLVAPTTCQHLKKASEVWEYFGGLDIFKLGVPHNYSGTDELEYYTNRLKTLKERLESLTGNEITDEKISEAIVLFNRMRELFKKISLTRRSSPSSLKAIDFARLNHLSFYADPALMINILETLYKELENRENAPRSNAPRIMLAGPNLARGDYKILELVEEAGGEVVIEEICEGIRYYWLNIENSGDPLEDLARGYLRERLPCAFMRSSARKRFEFTLKLINEFNVSGLLWYELLCCETYDQEAYYFAQKMKENNIPMLIIESNYDVSNIGQMKTRVEAFLEIIEGGLGND